MAEKTSLEKSHSGWSNFKLTLLSILTAVFASGVWMSLALKDRLAEPLFWGLLIGSGALTLIGLLLFNAFKR